MYLLIGTPGFIHIHTISIYLYRFRGHHVVRWPLPSMFIIIWNNNNNNNNYKKEKEKNCRKPEYSSGYIYKMNILWCFDLLKCQFHKFNKYLKRMFYLICVINSYRNRHHHILFDIHVSHSFDRVPIYVQNVKMWRYFLNTIILIYLSCLWASQWLRYHMIRTDLHNSGQNNKNHMSCGRNLKTWHESWFVDKFCLLVLRKLILFLCIRHL